MNIVEQLILAACLEHASDWYHFAAAEHSIDHGEFTPPQVEPTTVSLALDIIDDFDLKIEQVEWAGTWRDVLLPMTAQDLEERDYVNSMSPS